MPKKLNLTAEERAARKREQQRLGNLRYRERHPERLAATRAKRSTWNKEYQKAWYQKKKDALKAKQRLYYQEHREQVLSYQKQYQEKNREKVTARTSKWFKKKMQNPEYAARQSKVCVDSMKKRMKADPVFRVLRNLRCRLKDIVRSCASNKSASMMEIVGCTMNELRTHLAAQFEPWMNWTNYGFGEGKWVVDHIKPCVDFDLSKPEQQRECFSYKNLRPRCWRENMEHGCRLRKRKPAPNPS